MLNVLFQTNLTPTKKKRGVSFPGRSKKGGTLSIDKALPYLHNGGRNFIFFRPKPFVFILLVYWERKESISSLHSSYG